MMHAISPRKMQLTTSKTLSPIVILFMEEERRTEPFFAFVSISTSPFPYHRLVSLSLREQVFTSSSSAQLMTELNRLMAVERLYCALSMPMR